MDVDFLFIITFVTFTMLIASNFLLYFVAYVFAVDGAYPIIFVAAGIVNLSSNIVVDAESNLILFKPVQPLKTCTPILVTPCGMLIVVKPVQTAKARSPILVTPCGMLKVVKPL